MEPLGTLVTNGRWHYRFATPKPIATAIALMYGSPPPAPIVLAAYQARKW